MCCVEERNLLQFAFHRHFPTLANEFAAAAISALSYRNNYAPAHTTTATTTTLSDCLSATEAVDYLATREQQSKQHSNKEKERKRVLVLTRNSMLN